MERYLLAILLLITLRMPGLCVPAFPGKVYVSTESGDTVGLFLKGDESNKFAISTDGYLLAPKNDSWYFITKDSNDVFSISDIQIGENKSSDKEKFIKEDSLEHYLVHKISISPNTRTSKLSSSKVLSGVSHSLVVLIEFKDVKFSNTAEEISDLFNKINYDVDGARGSVRDFYQYASYGQFDLISDIYGPYVAINNMDFYGGNDANGNDIRPEELVMEAINNLPDDVDLSLYDNNNDGIVDNVHIIFAGYGEESGGPSRAIWSHEHPYKLPITKNGYDFAGYSCTPELRGNMGNGLSRIGVICHELGHAFGANDYYDVDYASNGSYDGTGIWDLMASGSWNDNGISPANFNPYVKLYDFGWVKPTIIDKSGSYALPAYNHYPDVIKIPTNNPDEFYLMENRLQESFDTGLLAEGVLIYHVHPLIESKRDSNLINNQHPQCIYPVCASSSVSPFETSDYGDINSAGCPFPGDSHNTQFSESSMPQAFLWSGESPQFSIENININEGVATFDMNIGDFSHNDPGEILNTYHEDFENGLNRYYVESIAGNAIWKIYPTGSLTSLNGMPDPYESAHALMLYDGSKNSRPSKSTLTSGRISLHKDSIYTISFWAIAPDNHSSGHQQFSLLIKGTETNQWEAIYENSNFLDKWTEIIVDVPHGLKDLYFCLSGEILNNGIFIDNLKISSNSPTNVMGINMDSQDIDLSYHPFSITAHTDLQITIHNLSGNIIYRRNLSPQEVVTPLLEKGIYIIRTNYGHTYKVYL